MTCISRNKKKEIRNYVDRKADEKGRMLSDMLMKWKMFPANNKLRIQKYNGEYVNYSGIKFDGSAKIVFRSFFDPYIEAYCVEMLKDIFEYLKERHISCSSARDVTKESLKQFASKFYSEMYAVDKALSKEQKIDKINEFIEKQVNSYCYETFWSQEKIWKTALVILGIGGGCFVVKLAFQIVVINYFNK